MTRVKTTATLHLKALLIHHEVIVPITGGKLDLGTWQRIFYAEFDAAGQAGDCETHGGVMKNGHRRIPGRSALSIASREAYSASRRSARPPRRPLC